MKVLHVCESIKGGCGSYLNELLRVQIEDFTPQSLRVLVPAQHVSQLSAVRKDIIDTFDRPNRKLGLVGLAREFLRVYLKFRPDIVHIHSTFSGVVVRILRPFLRAKLIYCPHGWAFDMRAPRIKQQSIAVIERVLSWCCDRVVAISDYERMRGINIGIAERRIVAIPNGINAAPPEVPVAAWVDGRLKVLFVGRLDVQKGFDVLLEAIQPIKNRVTVRVIGDSVVERKKFDSQQNDGASYLGWLGPHEIASHMMACDVVVMPSRWEGFGLVAIEAMRLKKPVVASSVGGLVEIIVNGTTGYLVPPDSANALRSCILSLDDVTLKRLGEAGFERFLEMFTVDRTHKTLVHLYEDVLAGRL
jgi:glycosyltransferase involved in cell wall biosynthesis